MAYNGLDYLHYLHLHYFYVQICPGLVREAKAISHLAVFLQALTTALLWNSQFSA